MKTFTTISLLSLVSLVLFNPAAGQTDQPAGVTGGMPGMGPGLPVKLPATGPALPITISAQCDIAWQPEFLTLDKVKIQEFIDWCQPGLAAERWLRDDLARLDIAFRDIDLADVKPGPLPQPTSMPADTKGWKAGRFTATLTILRLVPAAALPAPGKPLPRDTGPTSYITKEHIATYQKEFPYYLVNSLENWLTGQDKQQAKSKAIYDAIAKEISTAAREWEAAGKVCADLGGKVNGLKMDLVAKASRWESAQVQIAKLKAQSEDRVKEDPVVKELMTILVLRETAYKQAMQMTQEALKKGAATQAEAEGQVRDAQLKLIEAKVQLAQRREAVAGAAVGEMLTRLVNEQISTEIDVREIVAKLRYITEQSDKLAAADRRVDELRKQRTQAYVWRVLGGIKVDSEKPAPR